MVDFMHRNCSPFSSFISILKSTIAGVSVRRARLRTSAQAPAQHLPRARFIAPAKLSISLVASDSLLYHQNVKLNNLNESLIVYGYNYLWRQEEKGQIVERALELYLEKRRTIRILTGHIPPKPGKRS